MRIALLHYFSWPTRQGAAERYLHDLAWYLDRRGNDVTLVVGPSMFPVLAEGRTHVVTLSGKGRQGWLPALAVAHLLRNRYDVAHALVPSLALAASMTGHPTVYTEDGSSLLWSIEHPRGVAARVWRTGVRASHVIVVPRGDLAEEVAHRAARRAVVIPPALRTAASRPSSPGTDSGSGDSDLEPAGLWDQVGPGYEALYDQVVARAGHRHVARLRTHVTPSVEPEAHDGEPPAHGHP